MRRNYRNSELKKRALLAKQRMRMGFFEQIREERERTITQAIERGQVPDERARGAKEVAYRAISMRLSAEDEILYQRVCTLLDSDADISNPIGKLVDQELYARMDSTQRQRYILQLASKFREMSERYYAERNDVL